MKVKSINFIYTASSREYLLPLPLPELPMAGGRWHRGVGGAAPTIPAVAVLASEKQITAHLSSL